MQMLAYFPEMRPGLEGIRTHAYFKGIHWDIVRARKYECESKLFHVEFGVLIHKGCSGDTPAASC